MSCDDFFFKPYEAAKLYPDTDYRNLAYWSRPFTLEGNTKSDSYHMIAYSIPLVYQGTVYGVMGVEISENYLAEMLPVRELNSQNQGSYMLARAGGGRKPGSYGGDRGGGFDNGKA